MCVDPLAAVVVDESEPAAGIQLQAGDAIMLGAVEELPTVAGDNLEQPVAVLQALLLGGLVFCSHRDSLVVEHGDWCCSAFGLAVRAAGTAQAIAC